MSGIQHAVKRDYLEVDGLVYALPHDMEERSRLILQHNLLVRIFDRKVLRVPVELQDGDWVLDTGTGTGIWLQDLIKEVSTKPHCVGIDIESNFFPQPSALPRNLTFEIHSVLNLPEGWTNKFTLVHQRLLIAALRRHEWELALKEMCRVLKPGGWVQLLEWKPWTSGPALAKHLDLLYMMSDDLGMMHRHIIIRIPDILKQSGFVNIHQDTRDTPLGPWAGQDGIDGKENVMALLQGFKTPILKGGGYGVVNSEAEYDELVEEIFKEIDAIPGSTAPWTMFWAQKPLE